MIGSHVLYTGITGDLPRRVFEHKNKLTPGFTSRYKRRFWDSLVFESFLRL